MRSSPSVAALWRGALTLSAALLGAESWVPGPQVTSYLSVIDDSDQPYALYLPRDFDPAQRYPLVLALHGAASDHRQNLRRVFGNGNQVGDSDLEPAGYFPKFRDVEFIVASPLARGTMGYQGIAEADVYAVLDDVKRRFRIDEDRVYLTGLSMGGGGALWLGLTRPDLWAGLAVVCPHVPPGVEELAPNALHTPVRFFQGDADPVVPAAGTRRWQRRLIDLGGEAEYVEYPNVRHNAWDYAYRDTAVFDWFAGRRRQPHPDRVRFSTRAYRCSSAWWVAMDAITPGTLATIDAKLTAGNRVEAATSNLDGFTLRLAGHPQYSAGQPAVVAVDGSTVRVRVGGALSFTRTATGWKAGRAAAEGKRAGAEGPIAEAVATRHLYVYGTADAPSAAELQRRREVARRAADWNEPRARLRLSLAVKPDTEVNDSDLDTASLVVFGTRRSNRVLARWADRLPLALDPGAADYGLLYIYPAGRHYLLVNSGLPFWTGAEFAHRPGYQYTPALPRLLASFGDFILFKGGVDNVVTEGRFDRNWKLPSDAAATIAATGTVTIR